MQDMINKTDAYLIDLWLHYTDLSEIAQKLDEFISQFERN